MKKILYTICASGLIISSLSSFYNNLNDNKNKVVFKSDKKVSQNNVKISKTYTSVKINKKQKESLDTYKNNNDNSSNFSLSEIIPITVLAGIGLIVGAVAGGIIGFLGSKSKFFRVLSSWEFQNTKFDECSSIAISESEGFEGGFLHSEGSSKIFTEAVENDLQQNISSSSVSKSLNETEVKSIQNEQKTLDNNNSDICLLVNADVHNDDVNSDINSKDLNNNDNDTKPFENTRTQLDDESIYTVSTISENLNYNETNYESTDSLSTEHINNEFKEVMKKFNWWQKLNPNEQNAICDISTCQKNVDYDVDNNGLTTKLYWLRGCDGKTYVNNFYPLNSKRYGMVASGILKTENSIGIRMIYGIFGSVFGGIIGSGSLVLPTTVIIIIVNAITESNK